MIFHVVSRQDRYRTLCLKKGDKAPVLTELALAANPDWVDVAGAICVDCARKLDPSKILFAVASEIVGRDGRGHRIWIPDGITYVHATNDTEARIEWAKSAERNTRIVACGQVIGYHILDTKGDLLSV